MTDGLFWSSYDETVSFLNQKNLLKEVNSHKWNPYSEECKEYSRGNDYIDIYQKMVDHRDYDILLFDDSMFQMSFTEGESRLLFIQNPLYFMTFEAFLLENGIEYNPQKQDAYRDAFFN